MTTFNFADDVSIVWLAPRLSEQTNSDLIVLSALQLKEDDVHYQADGCVRGPGGVGPLLPAAGG